MNRQEYQRDKRWLRAGNWIPRKCPSCGNDSLLFFDKYDSIVCVECDCWLSEKCGDENCPYCAGRPDTPSQAIVQEYEENSSRDIGTLKDSRRKKYQRHFTGAKRHQMRRAEYERRAEKEEFM
ncbi:MAG: hypothetical protein NC347_12025 [Clostridium sp.]|nr:hypothetical protein [Clostridium sp.]